jgi:hypothetical protein
MNSNKILITFSLKLQKELLAVLVQGHLIQNDIIIMNMVLVHMVEVPGALVDQVAQEVLAAQVDQEVLAAQVDQEVLAEKIQTQQIQAHHLHR